MGKNGQTKKILLNEKTNVSKNTIKKNDKLEYEFKANDVGKVRFILLRQIKKNLFFYLK